MALGPTFYFKEYKNLTTSQLKKHLRNLQTPQHMQFLQRLREEEINAKIDDTNAWADHHTSIAVLNLLIEYKTLYPKSDLSDCDDYFAVENAVKQNAGSVETQRMVASRNTKSFIDECVTDKGELPIMPPSPLPPICTDDIVNK